MKKSTKAALFSAFVFPGAGLLWLKHYLRAAIFMVPAILAFLYIVNKAMAIANKIAKDIVNGSLPLDITYLAAHIHNALYAPENHLEEVKWFFIACWVLSIISSYFVGKQMDMSNATNNGTMQ